MILYTLHDNPMKYLDILLIARYNADVETSHYATTVISNAQKDFQNEVQNLSAAISQHPDDIEAIDSYISAVDRYINSGLLEEILLKNQRISFGQVLDKKLSLVPDDQPTLIKKSRNHIKLNESSEAAQTLKTLKQFYPRDEDTWIEAIRVCVESHDRTRLKETLSNIKNNPINWSNSGRARLDYWLEDVS